VSQNDRLERIAPELKITINNQGQLYLSDLGVLFEAIATDYNHFTKGRKLVAVRLETGSIIAIFQDAMNFIKPYVDGGEIIAKFVHILIKLWGKVSPVNAGHEPKRPRTIGMRTIRVDSDAKCNPVDRIGSSRKSRVSHSEPPPSARFPGDKDGSARRNIEPLQ
jgi:hypothetical protein